MGARTPPDRGRHWRVLPEKEVYQGLATLNQRERFEALRDVPLARSDKLCGPARIVLIARGRGLLDDVLEAIRSYHSRRPAPTRLDRPAEPPTKLYPTTTRRPSKRRRP